MSEPVCFGAITARSADSERCKDCPVFERCGERVQQALQEVAGEIDMGKVMAMHRALFSAVVPVAQPAEPDPGTLHTQGDPGEELKTRQANAKKLAATILRQLLKGMKKADFLKTLAGGVNPHARALTEEGPTLNPDPLKREQWLVCELLRRPGALGRATWEDLLDRTLPDGDRRDAIIPVLLAAKIIVQTEDGKLERASS